MFKFDNSFARDMEGFYAALSAEPAPQPILVALNSDLAAELDIDPEVLRGADWIDILAGNRVAEGSVPLAQAYAGHQFGGFSPSLGDGRALLIGEVIDRNGNRRDIQLKGSGRTPFSRNGDGKAALGPVLREYLVSEAMHALGIPTTRSLAAIATGEPVIRERRLPGAVLTRVAASHIRVGTFQFFAARGQTAKVRQLTDYAIARHDPDLEELDPRAQVLAFLDRVVERQSRLIAKWMSVGFIHGVMNTDNMTISGETIDYGPCAFMDVYDPETVFSSIDDLGRYAYKMQPVMAQWNLARLAECLLDLISPDDPDEAVRLATERVEAFGPLYQEAWLKEIQRKLGLQTSHRDDRALAEAFLETMKGAKADYTLSFRRLSGALEGKPEKLLELLQNREDAEEWLARWLHRHNSEKSGISTRVAAMDAVNPAYIPRNHRLEGALEEAVAQNNLDPFFALLERVTRPFETIDGAEAFEMGAPPGSRPHVTFCGT